MKHVIDLTGTGEDPDCRITLKLAGDTVTAETHNCESAPGKWEFKADRGPAKQAKQDEKLGQGAEHFRGGYEIWYPVKSPFNIHSKPDK
jgi:hypothetical protein